MFVVLLILISNVAFAKDVEILETFESIEKVLGDGETTYFYAGSKLVASKDSSGVTYHYQDRLGSDVDSKSLPFGQSLKEGERFSFTGKELDSELHYFNARYYDSSIGRFTSVDPVPSEPAYQYVGNNPVMFVDPSGKDSFVAHDLSWSVMIDYNPNSKGSRDLAWSTFKLLMDEPLTTQIFGMGPSINTIYGDAGKGKWGGAFSSGKKKISMYRDNVWVAFHEAGHAEDYFSDPWGYRSKSNLDKELFADQMVHDVMKMNSGPMNERIRMSGEDVDGWKKSYWLESPWPKHYGDNALKRRNIVKYWAQDVSNFMGPAVKKVGRAVPFLGAGIGLYYAASEAKAGNWGRAGTECLGIICDPIDYGVGAYDLIEYGRNNEMTGVGKKTTDFSLSSSKF